MEPTIILEVRNHRTNIHGANGPLLDALDSILRYPTEIAEAQANGWTPPTASFDQPQWDGWVKLLHRPKTNPPWFLTGLLQEVCRCLDWWREPYQVQDFRVRPQDELPEYPALRQRSYQDQAANRAVELGRGVLDMVPRSGKTRTMVEIQRRLNHKTLWIAPTDRIVSQTRDVIEQHLGTGYVAHVVGARGAKGVEGRRVLLCTAATALRLPQELYDGREMIVVDEWHHAASSSYREIFDRCQHIYYRFGMTGTFFRSGGDALAMHALLGNTIFKVTAEDMLSMGYLVPTKVAFMPVETQALPKSMGTFNQGHGKYGIHECRDRNWLCAWTAYQLQAAGKKVLVLVGTKAQGRAILGLIQRHLRPSWGKFEVAEFVSTDTKRSRIAATLRAFLESDAVKILIGTSLLGEGVDLPVADALVYARGEKAEVSLIQNAYRVGTACEGKTSALIVDFADRHHHKLLAHSQERMRVYFEEPTFTPEVLERPEDFFSWSGSKPAGLVRYRD